MLAQRHAQAHAPPRISRSVPAAPAARIAAHAPSARRVACAHALVRLVARAAAPSLARLPTAHLAATARAPLQAAQQATRRAVLPAPPHAALSVAAQDVAVSSKHAPRAHAHSFSTCTQRRCAQRARVQRGQQRTKPAANGATPRTACATAAPFGGAVRVARPRRCLRRVQGCLVTRAGAGLRPGAARTGRKAATHLLQHTFAAAT